MARAEAAMRTYLRDVIGIADPMERREAIQSEGLNVITDFAEFDKEDIETLCASVRKPGGSIANPNAGIAGQPAVIPNPGHAIPAICEKRLILAAFTAKIYRSIGRVINQNSMNRERLKQFEAHRLLIEEHDDPEKLPVVSKTMGIVKAMDMVPSHLRERLGITKVALSYIIRPEAVPGPIPEQEDSAAKPNSATAEGYETIMDELIEFTPHVGLSYAEDNARVFQIVQDMVAGTSFEASIKSHQRSRNGRDAYLSLCMHNMGSSKWDKIIEDAESYVMKREWNGRNQRFTLRAHIAKHREAHNDMMRATQHVEFELPNEHTRVGRLIKSITTKEPAIVSAITHIQGSPTQRDNFELAAEFLLLTAPNVSNTSNHRINSVKTKGKGKGNHKVGPNTGVELRYYTKAEYRKLNKNERKELAQLRKAAKDDSQERGADATNATVSALKQQVSELEERLIAVTKTNELKERKRESNPLSNPLNQRSS